MYINGWLLKYSLYLLVTYLYMVGGFNPSEKYQSNWKGRKLPKYLKPPPSKHLHQLRLMFIF